MSSSEPCTPRPGGACRRAESHCATARAFLLASLLLTACYSSRPLASSVPEPDTRIVARLTEKGSAELAPRIGLDAVEVEGVVGEIGENGWEVGLLRVEHKGGRGVFWNREVVVFPEEALASVRVRRLNTTRTALFAGVVTAAVIVVGRAFGTGGFLSGGDGNGTQPPQ